MAEENIDANTGAEDTTGADSSSDAVQIKPMEGDDGLISTVEYETVEKEESADTDTSDDDNSGDAEQNTSEDHKTEKQDFHEHPRFKELIESNRELKNQIDELKKLKESHPDTTSEQQQLNFKNIMDMDDDKIVEEFSDNPKGFLSNLALQISHEIRSDLQAEASAKEKKASQLSAQQQAEKTRNDFFKDKSDGQEMLSDGRIKDFIDKNPGHNEISAYYALAGEADVQSKIDAAVKKTEERIYKELKAKGKAKSTATSTGGKLINTDKSPEMQNPDKFGGTENVLLKRFLARQSA